MIRKVLPLFIIILTGLVYIFSQLTAEHALRTLLIIINSLFPAIFPFLVFTALLIEFGGARIIGYFLQFVTLPLFNISGEGSTLVFLGTFSGYPYTAIYGAELASNNDAYIEEAQNIVNTIFFPSFNFVMVVIAGIIADIKVASLLLISLYLSGFIMLFFRSTNMKKTTITSWQEVCKSTKKLYATLDVGQAIRRSIFSSITAFINMAGVILIFSTISFLLQVIIKTDVVLYFLPLIEITTGLMNVLSSKQLVYLLPIYFGLCGGSILLQAAMFIKNSKLTYRSFILNRLVQTVFNLLIFAILIGLFI